MPESVGFVASAFGSGGLFGGAAAATAGETALTAVATGVGTAVAGKIVGDALAPSAPELPPVTAMPDPLAQEQARKEALIEQMARRGRASTILTASGGDGKLGG